jgi:hypothetical protein
VVSVLEGGYSLSAPKQSAKDKKASQNLPTSSLVSTRGGGRGSNTVLATDTSKVADLTRKYAQLPGDGGLVKRFQHFFFSGLRYCFVCTAVFWHIRQRWLD